MSIPRELPISDFPYPDDRGQTHSTGCWKWRGHHNCAVARVRALEARLAEAEALISDLADTVQGYALGEMVGSDLEDAEATVARARAFLEGKE